MRKILLSILLVLAILIACAPLAAQQPTCSWVGVLRGSSGKPVAGATVQLSGTANPSKESQKLHFAQISDSRGVFTFAHLPAGTYTLSVQQNARAWTLRRSLQFRAGERDKAWISLGADERHLSCTRAKGLRPL